MCRSFFKLNYMPGHASFFSTLLNFGRLIFLSRKCLSKSLVLVKSHFSQVLPKPALSVFSQPQLKRSLGYFNHDHASQLPRANFKKTFKVKKVFQFPKIAKSNAITITSLRAHCFCFPQHKQLLITINLLH